MKKKLIIALCIILCLVVIAGVIGVTLYNKHIKIDSKPTIGLSSISTAEDISLTAHRGLSAVAPENSLPAIEEACKKGYKYIEFDVHTTKDGVWILNHDENISKMTNGSKYINEYTFEEIRKFKINNGANYKNYDNLNLATLDEALALIKKYPNSAPMIEIKNFTHNSIEDLVNTIRKHGLENNSYVISFKEDALNEVEKINRYQKLAFLISEANEETDAVCQRHQNWDISFNASPEINTKQVIDTWKSEGRELFCWTVDQKEYIDFYYPLGIKNFVTNCILP